VSPRTVRRYMPRQNRPPNSRSTQSWTTFLHNHAGAVLACDFFVVATATFQRLYGFVILDITTRRVLHRNVTAHPTAEWTIQQFRNGLPLDAAYRFVVHDRDGIFAPAVDDLSGPCRSPSCARRDGHRRRTRIANGLSAPPDASASTKSFR
jgi:putative transposase